jgi:hypothetical protein
MRTDEPATIRADFGRLCDNGWRGP